MSFQSQQDILFQSYLDRYCKNQGRVEFIISSACNQRCEYCYLVKHGNEMEYPKANKREDILHNLPIFLEYLDENGYIYDTYDLFSGEFFQLPYWEEVFDIFYQYELKTEKRRCFSIPTNMSFITDDELTARVESWVIKFRDIGVDVGLSCSVDGPPTVESVERPNNKGVIKTDEDYDKLFTFLAKYQYACHPMITKEWLKNYKANYDFFVEKTIQHNLYFHGGLPLNPEVNAYNLPMLLEVRDPNQWDEESLKLYREFLFYVAEKDLEVIFKGDLREFSFRFFDDFSKRMREVHRYCGTQPYIIAHPTLQGGRMSCTVQKGIACRIGDLSLAPCHRLFYPQFRYGHFVLNEEKTKIIGVHGENPTLAFKIETLNPRRSMLKCTDCKFAPICIEGCLGSQYENTGEIFAAQQGVCDLLHTKYNTIHEIALKYNLYEIALHNTDIPIERRELIQDVRQQLFQ